MIYFEMCQQEARGVAAYGDVESERDVRVKGTDTACSFSPQHVPSPAVPTLSWRGWSLEPSQSQKLPPTGPLMHQEAWSGMTLSGDMLSNV